MRVGSHRSRRRRGGRGGGQGFNNQGAPHQGQNGYAVPGLAAPAPAAAVAGRSFEDLTSIDPQPRLTLEYPGCPASCRLVDLFCPIGRGQRGLIVSPPKAGKTTLLKDIGTAILRNHPDVELILLLVDERPEEVTDFRRTFDQVLADLTPAAAGWDPRLDQNTGEPKPGNHFVPPVAPAGGPTAGAGQNGGAGTVQNAVAATGVNSPGARCRVIASSNDHDVERHIAVATQTVDYAKKAAMAGKHIVVLMDSLTRMGRAFNRSRRHSNSGRTMSGGIDSRALEVPKQIFGSARNTEEAGSLTIIASCLVDTGSQGDQVIFEEFKGTGNMELILDRKISERRLFPAINLAASGTRKEHLLMPERELATVNALRRRLMNMPPPQQVEQLLAAIQRFPTNAALVGSPA